MKVVLVTNIPTPYRVPFLRRLGEGIEQSGGAFKVLFCATSEPGRYWDFDEKALGFRHEFMRGFHWQMQGHPFHLNMAVLRSIYGERPDYIICAGAWNAPTNIILLMFKAWIDAPIYFWSEGHRLAAYYQTGVIARFRRAIYRRFDGFWVLNQKSEEWALAQARPMSRSIFRVPNTIDPDIFDVQSSSNDAIVARSLANLGGQGRLFIQVSQIEPRKGVAELAEAFEFECSRLGSSDRLAFIGEGSLRVELQERYRGAAKTLHFWGIFLRSRLAPVLRGADGFFLNTFRDPNPLSAIEAAYSGLPLFLSRNAGNVSELIIENETGLTIDDAAIPGATVRKVLNTPTSVLRIMGANARRRVSEEFDVDEIVGRILAHVAKNIGR